MGLFDVFRTKPDVEFIRLRLHFVRPAYDAAREVVEDARLHWWDRDDGTVDITGDGASQVAVRALEAAQRTIPAERARVQALDDGPPRRALLARLAALEAEEPPPPWVHPDLRT